VLRLVALLLRPNVVYQVAEGQVDVVDVEAPGRTQVVLDPRSRVARRADVVDLQPGGACRCSGTRPRRAGKGDPDRSPSRSHSPRALALDRLIRTERLRADIAAYRRVPPTQSEIDLALLADTSGLADDTDWEALYPDEHPS